MDQLIQTVIIGLANGLIFAPRRARLHPRLRHHRAHQLRPWRRLHARLDAGVLPDRAGVQRRLGHLPGHGGHATAAVRRLDPRGARHLHAHDRQPQREPSSGSPTGRSATPPSSRLSISAIGVSYVLQNVGLVCGGAVPARAIENVFPSTNLLEPFGITGDHGQPPAQVFVAVVTIPLLIAPVARSSARTRQGRGDAGDRAGP